MESSGYNIIKMLLVQTAMSNLDIYKYGIIIGSGIRIALHALLVLIGSEAMYLNAGECVD